MVEAATNPIYYPDETNTKIRRLLREDYVLLLGQIELLSSLESQGVDLPSAIMLDKRVAIGFIRKTKDLVNHLKKGGATTALKEYDQLLLIIQRPLYQHPIDTAEGTRLPGVSLSCWGTADKEMAITDLIDALDLEHLGVIDDAWRERVEKRLNSILPHYRIVHKETPLKV